MKLKLKKNELVDLTLDDNTLSDDATPNVAGGTYYTDQGCHATRTCPATGSPDCLTRYCGGPTNKFECGSRTCIIE